MSKRVGKQSVLLKSGVSVISHHSIVGKKESEGPLGKHFEQVERDPYFGQENWEMAESRLYGMALSELLKKSGEEKEDINYIICGDLLDQCTASAFGIKESNIPYLGVYGACSTMAESLSVAAMLTDGGFSEKAICLAGSHFCSAEKQFRFPLQYGGQRPPTAQWTVTGIGAALIGFGGSVKIECVTTGKICDMGICDANNMGAAMAPAFADTVKTHFEDMGRSVKDYDLILSGDLGLVGMEIAKELLLKEGYDIASKYNDCGAMIFDKETQDTHAGGSGCGCSGSVLCGYILPQMEKGKYKNVLFVATGALMSATSGKQGQSIPAIAHAVAFSTE